MKKLLTFSGTMIVLLYLLSGCYPKGPEYYSDIDITATEYRPEYDFGSQKTFFLPDTVEYITNKEDSQLDPTDVAALLQAVQSKLEERGYQKINYDPQNIPDFVIQVSVIANEYTGIGWTPGYPCYPGWWGGCYPGYYPPGWGWYWTYSYSTGSVIIQWYDPDTDPTDGKQPIEWLAIFNGLISSSADNNKSRIAAGIDQAFKQSPYIQSK